MNWVIVVVAIVFVMMGLSWLAECRHSFTGVSALRLHLRSPLSLRQPKNIEALLLQSRLAAQIAKEK